MSGMRTYVRSHDRHVLLLDRIDPDETDDG